MFVCQNYNYFCSTSNMTNTIDTKICCNKHPEIHTPLLIIWYENQVNKQTHKQNKNETSWKSLKCFSFPRSSPVIVSGNESMNGCIIGDTFLLLIPPSQSLLELSPLLWGLPESELLLSLSTHGLCLNLMVQVQICTSEQ